MSAAEIAVLWDLDGTLLRSAGTGVRSFTAALLAVVGAPFPTTAIDMGGRTDPDIATLVLAAAGFDDPDLVAPLLAEVATYYTTIGDELRSVTLAKPGAAAALDAFASMQVAQTIVTGNIEPVARHKVAAAGLDQHLRFELGGYGSDHSVRAELVHLSRRRLADSGATVGPQHTWVIGDTPRDLACARDAGVRCALVATGTYPFEALEHLGADGVFADLTELDRLLTLVSS